MAEDANVKNEKERRSDSPPIGAEAAVPEWAKVKVWDEKKAEEVEIKDASGPAVKELVGPRAHFYADDPDCLKKSDADVETESPRTPEGILKKQKKDGPMPSSGARSSNERTEAIGEWKGVPGWKFDNRSTTAREDRAAVEGFERWASQPEPYNPAAIALDGKWAFTRTLTPISRAQAGPAAFGRYMCDAHLWQKDDDKEDPRDRGSADRHEESNSAVDFIPREGGRSSNWVPGEAPKPKSTSIPPQPKGSGPSTFGPGGLATRTPMPGLGRLQEAQTRSLQGAQAQARRGLSELGYPWDGSGQSEKQRPKPPPWDRPPPPTDVVPRWHIRPPSGPKSPPEGFRGEEGQLERKGGRGGRGAPRGCTS